LKLIVNKLSIFDTHLKSEKQINRMRKTTPYIPISLYSILIICYLIIGSCKGIQKETIVYKNDFERQSLSKISGGLISEYNGSKVVGRYSENGFVLKLDDLPTHNMVQIRFDL
jgi:hypothetical protein